jgi:hypothetical protein
MNVVFLARGRARWRPAIATHWTRDETAELTRLYRSKRDRGDAVGFAYGTTDFDDPQFYVLGADHARPCGACVSRLTRDGRSWYVVEDGQGGIEKEGGCLRTLVGQITRRSLAGWRTLATVFAYSAQAFLGNGFDPQDIASAAECLIAIA